MRNARANELLAALQGGGDLEALATEAGLDYTRHEAVKRNSFVPDSVLVKEIFRLPKPVEGEAIEAVLPSSNGFAVVQLDSVIQGDLDEGALMTKTQYERVISNSNASLENAALMSQLRASASIEVFEDRIK